MQHEKDLVINYKLKDSDGIYKDAIKAVEFSLFYIDFSHLNYTKDSKLSIGSEVTVDYGEYSGNYPVVSSTILENKVIEVTILIDNISREDIEYYLNDTVYTSIDIEIDGFKLTEYVNVIDVSKVV